MKGRVFPYLLLFLVSLALAYLASLPSKKDSGSQVWLDLDGHLDSLSFRDERVEIKIDFHTKVVDLTDLKSKKPVSHLFLGNDGLVELKKQIETMRAIKTIGNFADINQEEYGFQTDSSKFLSLKMRNESYKFDIGKRSFQSPHIYLHDLNRKKVILVSNVFIRSMQNAKSQLIERRLIQAELGSEVSSIQLNHKEKVFTLVPGEGASSNGLWMIKGREPSNKGVTNWIKKLMGLRVKSYVKKEDVSSALSIAPILLIRINLIDGNAEELLVYRDSIDEPKEYIIHKDTQELLPLLDLDKLKTLLDDLEEF